MSWCFLKLHLPSRSLILILPFVRFNSFFQVYSILCTDAWACSRVVAAFSMSIMYSFRFIYISDYFSLFSGPESRHLSRPYNLDFHRPTLAYPSFLFPPSAPPTHGTAHASGTNRTHRTGTGTGTDFHTPVEETLITSLQFPEFIGPGESDFLYCSFITVFFFCYSFYGILSVVALSDWEYWTSFQLR